MYQQTIPWSANYNESEMPSYPLPELLTCSDGTRVTTKEEWIRKRRPELLKLFQEYMYGSPLPMPDKVVSTLLTEKKDARNGLAIRREIRLDFCMNDGRRHSVIVLLYIPHSKEKVPVFINLTFGGNQSITKEEDITMTGLIARRNIHFLKPGEQAIRYPIDEIMKRGYALVVASYHDFFPDFENGWAGSVYELFRSTEEIACRPKDASSIAAWAWGFSRLLDLAASQLEIDGTKAACIGHSRIGKTSLWAGVQDERFRLVCVNDSGCGGAALDRRLYGETLYSMVYNSRIGYWFTDKMESYAYRPQDLPFDQHELIALAAPRAVAVHSATDDQWADPKGEYLSAYYAGPVFRLFGKEPLKSETPPEPDCPVGTDVSYFLRTGIHHLLSADWECYLDAADRVFKK